MNEIRNKSLFKAVGYGLLCLVIGVLFIFGVIKDNSNYVSFESLQPNQISNQNVEFNIYDAYGCAIEETSYNKKTKVETTTYLYYVILTGDLDAEDCRYMCVKVPVKYQDKFEKIVDLTYNGQLAEEPFHGFGKINAIDSEEYKYFKEFFTEAGWTEDEINQSTIPYYIGFKSGSAVSSAAIAVAVIGVIFVAIGLFLIINFVTGGFLKRLKKDIAQAGISEEQFLEDYRQAEVITKKDSIRLGRYFIYTGLNSIWPRAIKVEDALWAHQKVTTHRRGLIKVGTTYEINVYDVNRRMENSEVKKEAEALAILEKMGEKYPWMVIGYSKELDTLFYHDLEQFKGIKYNEVYKNDNMTA